jgi:hypothetical protein
MRKKVLDKYFSDTAELLGEQKTQSIFVLDNHFEIAKVDLFPDYPLGFDKNNFGISGDTFRVEIRNKILGKIIDGKFDPMPIEHFPEYVDVINSPTGLKIWTDTAISWYDGPQGLVLADMYVFEKDVLKALGNGTQP